MKRTVFSREAIETANYDVVIIGGGAAGLSAAINAAADGLSVIVVEGQKELGGQIMHTDAIQNLMGHSIVSGRSLIAQAAWQALDFGAQILPNVGAVKIAIDGDSRIVRLSDGSTVRAKAVIIASGLNWRHIHADNERELVGKGILYGALAKDAPKHKGENIVIIGGANSAGQAACHWSDYVAHVTLVVREHDITMKMSDYLVEKVRSNPKVTVLCDSQITRCEGVEKLEAVVLNNGQRIPCDAAIVYVGSEPRTEWLNGTVELDDRGYVVTDKNLCTSESGIFAIGDVRDGIAKRVSAALGDGSEVIASVHDYFKKLKEREIVYDNH